MEPILRNNRKFEDVLLRIREEIAERNMKPGDKLMPEREMAEALQVSRTSVREALRILEIFDVIYSKPGEGTVIKKPDIANLLSNFYPFILMPLDVTVELLETRKVLEGGIAVLAASRRQEEDIQRLQEAVDRMHSDDLAVLTQADLDFHAALSQAAHNKTLSDIMLLLSDMFTKNLQSNRLHVFAKPGADEALYKHHAAILEAIIAKDGNKAKEALELSFDYVNVELEKRANI